MDMNNVNIEEIVKQVLSGMTGNAPAAAAATSAPAAPAGNTIPKKARVAMMTEKKHFELQEYDLPEVGDDDILVKVEGCGVCGTDAHEYKNDPFGLIPVVLGHEGTGEIVKMGKNVKVDTAGKPVKVGDKIVTCMIFKDDPEITMFDLNKKNVGGADVYGLLPDDDVKFNGWFADYIFIRGGKFGSTFFNVSEITGNFPIYSSHSSFSRDTFSPLNSDLSHPISRNDCSIFIFRDFPKRRGRVNRFTSPQL